MRRECGLKCKMSEQWDRALQFIIQENKYHNRSTICNIKHEKRYTAAEFSALESFNVSTCSDTFHRFHLSHKSSKNNSRWCSSSSRYWQLFTPPFFTHTPHVDICIWVAWIRAKHWWRWKGDRKAKWRNYFSFFLKCFHQSCELNWKLNYF